jgi:hypothetical protein
MQPLRVEDYEVRVGVEGYRLTPHPDAFRTGIRCGPNREPVLSLQHAIRQEGFACALRTSDDQHGDLRMWAQCYLLIGLLR